MPTETANYGFTKDNEDEFYNINTVNANLDKIDTEMKRIDTKLDTHIKDDPGHTRYIGSTNAVNAWTCTSNLIIWDGTKPKAGVAYRLFAAGANTGAVTLVLSSTSPAITSSTYPVYGMDGKALTAGAVAQGAMVTVCFSGSAFFLQGSGSGVTAGTQASRVYATPGSYNVTVPDGVTRIIASMWGAGGGGGGVSSNNLYGGGGGGSGFFKEVLLQVLPGQNLTVQVGSGGNGGGVGASGVPGQMSFVQNALNGSFYVYAGGGGESGQSSYGGRGGGAATTNATGLSYNISNASMLKDGTVTSISQIDSLISRKLISGGTGSYGSSYVGGGGGGSPSDMYPGVSGGRGNSSNAGSAGGIGFYSTWFGGRGGDGQSSVQANGSYGAGGGGGSAPSNGSTIGGKGGDGMIILVW